MKDHKYTGLGTFQPKKVGRQTFLAVQGALLKQSVVTHSINNDVITSLPKTLTNKTKAFFNTPPLNTFLQTIPDL